MLKTKQRQWLKALTFRDDPYPGLLFATSLGILPVNAFSLLCYSHVFSVMNLAATAMVVFGILWFWFVFTYALNIRANAIDAFIKPLNLGKWGKKACRLLLFLSDGLLLTFLSYRKRRYTALFFSVCVLIASIGALLLYLKSFAWLLPYYGPIGHALFVCKCGVLLSLYGEYTRKGMVKLIPFAIALVICIALYVRDVNIKREQNQIKARIASLVDYPNSTDSLEKLLASGVSPEEKPLKSLAEYEERIAQEEYPSFVAERQEVQKAYGDFLAMHADFISAVREIAADPPERIAHSWQGPVFGVELPELKFSGKATRFLALEMRANPDDRDIIASRNREMMALRDWLLRTPLLMSTYAASSVDWIRLEALALTLAHNDYSLDEWEELLGPSLDWKTHFARSIATEGLALNDIDKSLFSDALAQFPLGDKIAIPLINYGGIEYFALAIQQDSSVLTDWRFTERLIDFTLANQHSFAEMQEWDEENTRILEHGSSIIKNMFWPSLFDSAIHHNAILDDRQMAMLAFQVMDYRRSHNGTLPESLDALEGAITTSSDGRPFEYEHGILEHKNNYESTQTFQGFRISRPATEFENGRSPRASLAVSLD